MEYPTKLALKKKRALLGEQETAWTPSTQEEETKVTQMQANKLRA